MLFGEEGQTLIREATVGVIGVGGLGSHVAQQVAYLGVEHFVLVDSDKVSSSNLNRLIGATAKDVGQSKIDVIGRNILQIQGEASVEGIADRFQADSATDALNSVDIVFGCLDDDYSRLALTDWCSRHTTPLIDLATDTGGDSSGLWYGGRVIFANNGERCLVCLDLLDQDAITKASMSPGQREEEDRLYGVRRAHLDEAGPSVVSLNGVVAAIAVTEFMAWRTRLRDPWPYLVYRGDLGRVTLNTDSPNPNCYYCKVLWGSNL